MQKMDVHFLQSIQVFHDSPNNWDLDENTISLAGKNVVNFIIKKHDLGKPYFKV